MQLKDVGMYKYEHKEQNGEGKRENKQGKVAIDSGVKTCLWDLMPTGYISIWEAELKRSPKTPSTHFV